MPIGRMGRPGLVGLAARTAVVAGTATAVSGGVARHQQRRAQDQYDQQQYEAAQQQAALDAAAQQAVAQQQAAYAQQQAAQQAYVQQTAPAAPAAPAGGVDVVAELQKLAALKEQGILSDDEFAAAKAKLLS
ncbi:SHOCT domain-containing protein [Microbacterium mangrovi]|nr:SHOCT domain-containing protein [Microbacterium mangrovi]